MISPRNWRHLKSFIRKRLKRTVIDIGPVDIRAHRIIGEHCFPHARCEFFDAAGGVLGDALQHIGEVDVRVNVVQSAGGEQALNDADALSADFSPAKQPRLAARRSRL
jgi:hypothetical protein